MQMWTLLSCQKSCCPVFCDSFTRISNLDRSPCLPMVSTHADLEWLAHWLVMIDAWNKIVQPVAIATNIRWQQTIYLFILFQFVMVKNTGNVEDRPCHCMLNACFCVYTACDFEDCKIGCVSAGDCLCCRHNCCLAVGHDSVGCGMTTQEDECCKIGCFCCDIGLLCPARLCTHAEQVFCIQQVGALPFDKDYVPDCVCAYCGIICAPECGCCAAPPPCPALNKLKAGQMPKPVAAMQRD